MGGMNRTLGKGSTCSKTLPKCYQVRYQQLSVTCGLLRRHRDWVWIKMTVSEKKRMQLTSPSRPQASQEPVLRTHLVGYLFLHSVYPQHIPTNSHWQGTESSLNAHSNEHRTETAEQHGTVEVKVRMYFPASQTFWDIPGNQYMYFPMQSWNFLSTCTKYNSVSHV